ncbi:ATP-binding protein [Streptomyces xanthochromogenes]|uniref:sensor histidine kinase n=1 Tax=Streptomyces xanthochromogenes TaxID=67384 RepID=UPI003447FE74
MTSPAPTRAPGPPLVTVPLEQWSRQRALAREMHDELGNWLAVALRRLELCEADPAPAHLDAAKHAVREAMGHTRRAIGELRRTTPAGPPGAALRAFAAEAAPPGTTVTIRAADQDPLAEAIGQEVFLMGRECLRNAFGHAAARHVNVVLRRGAASVRLTVEDDGVGFDARRIAADGAQGLRSLRERAAALGGAARVESGPGRGTRVDIEVPVEPSTAPR